MKEQRGTYMDNSAKGAACLLIGALIWGVAFVAQRVGMDYVGPYTFNAVRCLLGSLVLIPVVFALNGRKEKTDRSDRSVLLQGGIACGVFLCIASNFQQVGLKYTSVGKAGFITALYIVIVPLFGIILGKAAGVRIWISVALAVAGMYLLCMTDALTLGKGDLLELICAFAFAFQILAVDHYSRLTGGPALACLEFLVCGLLTLIPMFLFERPSLQGIYAARVPILYAGVLSCGVAYTLQIIGQRNLKPAVASLIMSLESVISVIAGWLILGQRLTLREIIGSAVMFAAILLAQM